MTKYTYKDFATGKSRWTRARFREWSEKMGPLNVRYAVLDRGRSTLFIPEYCLTPESKRAIQYELKFRDVPERVISECRLTRPNAERKHLFGISRKRHGYFLVNTPERCITREALREMFIEAKEEGLEHPLHIYCAYSCIAGPGMDIIQLDCDCDS